MCKIKKRAKHTNKFTSNEFGYKLRTFEEGRRCVICSMALSIYNCSRICHKCENTHKGNPSAGRAIVARQNTRMRSL